MGDIMLKINTEFRKGIMFIRLNGEVDKLNIDNVFVNDFKYVVLNLDNLLSIDSEAIKDIIDYNNKITKNNGKLIICNKNNNIFTSLFKTIPIIDSEIKAFNIVWKERYG